LRRTGDEFANLSPRKTKCGDSAASGLFGPKARSASIEREARRTRLVIWGEEHHLPQTRSLYEVLLRTLWRQGYRYLAAETFADELMNADFSYPDLPVRVLSSRSGFRLCDPHRSDAWAIS